MILDALAQGPAYVRLNPRFDRAFAFLRSVTPATPVGRHEIDGEEIYAFVQQHETKLLAEKKLEVHRRYIDIQYVVRGREVIAWAPLAALSNPTMLFDPAVDAALYTCPPDVVPVQVSAGHFALLFPEDAHAPSCAWDTPAEVLKVVVKVQV
jgi:YhcH/YjgK/YiaL family protein